MGTGCLCALGRDVPSCIARMFEGTRNCSLPKMLSTDHPETYPVFQVPGDVMLPDFIDGQDAFPDLSLTARFALAAAHEALQDAGIDREDLKSMRVGVCMGTTVGCALNNDPFYADYKAGKNPDMTAIHRYLNSNPAACVARYFELDGPVQTVVNACASGTDAVGIGASWIKAGLCDLVIAGGTDELCRVTYNGFISLMITDTEPSRPFDQTRQGLNLGEGAGAVVLRAAPESDIAGTSPKCRIAGYGSSCDAHHLTAPAPDGRGLKTAIQMAIKKSNLALSDIGFINAHGTGTRDNDRVEGRVLSAMLPDVPFFSTKGYTGHTLGAAGAIEAVFTIRHLMNQRIPASIGFSTPDDDIGHSPVQESADVSCKAAISESIAFGGNNAVLVFAI